MESGGWMNMKIQITALLVALSATAFAAGGGAAFAQSNWTIDGITFDQRAGWCVKNAVQDGIPVLEIRPCGSDFPYVSVGKIATPEQGKNLDLPGLLATAMQNAATDENRASTLKLATDKYGSCTMLSYSVDQKPIPGITGYAVLASFNCPAAPNNPRVEYRNFNTAVRRPDGAVWAVAFDYPTAPMSAEDTAMITSAIGRIAAAQ
jgi:hypothetical protein